MEEEAATGRTVRGGTTQEGMGSGRCRGRRESRECSVVERPPTRLTSELQEAHCLEGVSIQSQDGGVSSHQQPPCIEYCFTSVGGRERVVQLK